MFFQIRLIILNWNLESGFNSNHNKRLLYFIVTITLLYLPLFIPGIFGIIFKLPWFNAHFVILTYGVSLAAVSIYLFVSPDILYGFLPEVKFSLPKPIGIHAYEISHTQLSPEAETKETLEAVSIEAVETKSDISQTVAEEAEIAAELEIVLKCMEEYKPYRKQGFTIQDLSNQTEIPVYQLSPLINNSFNMNFANWVNRYRVEYFITQAKANPQLTLEALSKEAGFISRSTFINAFKKEKGVTPREFLKNIKVTA